MLGDNLYNCTPFECDTVSADKKNIHSRIIGFNSGGDCVHEQSTEDGEKVLCRYSDESRKFLALRIRKYNTDLANMPQGSEFEESILADIFHNECDVSSPKGADDKPAVESDEPESLDEDYNEDEEGQASSMDDDTAEGSKVRKDEEPIEDNGDLTEEK